MVGIRQVVGDYMDYATIHGVGRSKNSPFIILKILWVLVLCASLGMVTWQVYELNLKYKSAPISTSIEMNYASQLEFPSITICNTNPAMYSKLDHDSDLNLLLNEASDKYSVDISVFNTTSSFYSYNFTEFDNSTQNKDVESDILSSTARRFKMLLSITDNKELERISQNISEFILMCNFLGQKCTMDMFEPVRTYDYGQCYVFDPWKDNRLINGMTAGYGPDYSLELLLNVNQAETLPFVTSSSGIVVLPNTTGGTFLDSLSGVFIPTGFETNVGLKHVVHENVPGMQTEKRCNENLDEDNLLDCREKCKQDFISAICDCYQYYFMVGTVTDTVMLNETHNLVYGYRPCYTDDDYKCIVTVAEMLVSGHPADCERCIPHCKRTEFQKDLLMFSWPTEKFIPILRRIMNARIPNSTNTGSLSRAFVTDNLAMVRVYLSTLAYDTIKEEYSYSVVIVVVVCCCLLVLLVMLMKMVKGACIHLLQLDITDSLDVFFYLVVNFISDVGGQLGLWAGFSVLSLLELVELVVILLARLKTDKLNNKVTEVTSINGNKTSED